MRKLPIWIALICLMLSGCGDMDLRNILADIVARASLNPITMVTINAASDSFQMGDALYGPNPPAGVTETISADYNMSKYEITNAQFAQFIADGGYSTQSYWTTNGWTWKASTTQPLFWTDINFNGINQPVASVSWYEAVAFCNWRSVKESLNPAYNSAGQATLSANGYRLPTEVEWEYAAAKGGSGQPERIYAWGDTWYENKAVCSVSPASASKTADVGSKSTAGDTLQSLADMSGNVWEWCSDNDEAVPANGPDRYYFVDDSTSQSFVIRGGSWNNNLEHYFRCAYGTAAVPGYRISGGVGFRVVRR